MDIIKELFENIIDAHLIKMVFGNPRKKSLPYKKILIRPLLLKGDLIYQIEYVYEKKVMHENVDRDVALDSCLDFIVRDFKQINIFTESEEIQVLAKNPAMPRVTRKQLVAGQDGGVGLAGGQPRAKLGSGTCDVLASGERDRAASGATPFRDASTCQSLGLGSGTLARLTHNKTKNYIIQNGIPCDFLIRLGVMGEDGQVHKKHYAKFRQINRYLEIVSDCMPHLLSNATHENIGGANTSRPLKIIDFGCGKAYLTFALYYYLKILKGLNVDIVGLDLKKDVIEFCKKIAIDLKYEGLRFEIGDIADYSQDSADMVVTLHACDQATDYALANAVAWNSKIILSVPCCQHELFSQIDNPENAGLLKHGILKDRFTEILTDGLRGLKLVSCGYDVAMIEFTSLEHTARNIMIKAVLKDPEQKLEKTKKSESEYLALRDFYKVNPTTDKIKPQAR